MNIIGSRHTLPLPETCTYDLAAVVLSSSNSPRSIRLFQPMHIASAIANASTSVTAPVYISPFSPAAPFIMYMHGTYSAPYLSTDSAIAYDALPVACKNAVHA